MHLKEANTGLGLGLVREDAEVSLKHLDNILLSYQKDWKTVGATVYTALNKHNIDRAGAAVIYRATDKTSFVADWIYKNKQHAFVLGARQQFTDKLGASIVGEVTDTRKGHASEAISASLDYQVNDNCSVVLVGKHDFRNKDTSLGVALKLSGVFEHVRK